MRTPGSSRIRLAILAMACCGSMLAFAGPAGAATYNVEFSGVVICDSGSWGVQGVWVENMNGSDGFARWWAFPGKQNAAKYRIAVQADRPDPTIRLDIGCGGDGGNWKKTLLTPDFRTRHGFTENRKCDVSTANRARSCKPAPHGPTDENGPGGDRGYCTRGAYIQWERAVGYFPSIGGNASQMDDFAETKGFQVSSVPHVRGMVVFNTGAGGLGHVGWVIDVYMSNGTVAFDYVDMNGGSGGTAANEYRTSLWDTFDTKRGKAWNPSVQGFIVAPS